MTFETSYRHLAKTREEPDTAVVSARVRVLLADDHALMRRSLRLLLDCEDDIEVIAEASNLAAVTRLVRSHQPHVLVLDLSMPDGSSIDAIGRVREEAPDTQIVVITMEENPVFARRAFASSGNSVSNSVSNAAERRRSTGNWRELKYLIRGRF